MFYYLLNKAPKNVKIPTKLLIIMHKNPHIDVGFIAHF